MALIPQQVFGQKLCRIAAGVIMKRIDFSAARFRQIRRERDRAVEKGYRLIQTADRFVNLCKIDTRLGVGRLQSERLFVGRRRLVKISH